MPNWCTNRIKFTGNYESVNKLYQFIHDQINIPFIHEAFRFDKNTFLGTFLERAGLNSDNFRYRGQIIEWPTPPQACNDNKDNYEITIYTESAWVPMIAMWLAIIKKISPDVQLFYASRECGMRIYQSNDPDYINNFIVDTWISSPDTIPSQLRGTMFGENYFDDDVSKDTLRGELLKAFPNRSDESTSGLIAMLKGLDFDDDNFVSINQWDYVSASEQE